MKSRTLNLLMILTCWIIPLSGFSQENVNLAMGNPSGATSDTIKKDNYLMVKPQYSLSYNNTKHTPNWVSWHVGSSDLGIISRQSNFQPDATLPANWYKVTPQDYSNSGFDKGQQCPTGDRNNSEENNSATFLMTNMIPQAPNNNRITWDRLESYCRKLVSQGNELYIICGPEGTGGTGSNGFSLELKHNVAVPLQLWKIIVVLPEGNDDIKRIDASTRVIAVLIPNSQECSEKEWGKYRVSVNQLQSLTGYDFLSNVPKDIQKIIEARIDDGLIN